MVVSDINSDGGHETVALVTDHSGEAKTALPSQVKASARFEPLQAKRKRRLIKDQASSAGCARTEGASPARAMIALANMLHRRV